MLWAKDEVSWQSIYANIVFGVKLLQSCPVLCDPMDSSPPGSPVHGILQARILEGVAICFSGESPQSCSFVVSRIASDRNSSELVKIQGSLWLLKGY